MPQIAVPFMQRPLPQWFGWIPTIIGAVLGGLMLGICLYCLTGLFAMLAVVITGSNVPTFLMAIATGIYLAVKSPSESRIKQFGYAIYGAGAVLFGLQIAAQGAFSPLILGAYMGSGLLVMLYERITTVRQVIRSPLNPPQENALKAVATSAQEAHSKLSKYASSWLEKLDDMHSDEDQLYDALKPYLAAEKKALDTANTDLKYVRANQDVQFSRPLKTISPGVDEHGRQKTSEKEVVQKRFGRCAKYLEDYTSDKVMWPLGLDTLIWFKLKYIEQHAQFGEVRIVDERIINIKNYVLQHILPPLRAYLGQVEAPDARPDWNANSGYAAALKNLVIQNTPEGETPQIDDPFGARERLLYRMVDEVEQHIRKLQAARSHVPARYQGGDRRVKPTASAVRPAPTSQKRAPKQPATEGRTGLQRRRTKSV